MPMIGKTIRTVMPMIETDHQDSDAYDWKDHQDGDAYDWKDHQDGDGH